jgi:AraC-like DNA-binding protein
MTVQYKSIREWREQYARRILNIDFKPLSDAPFCASVVPIFEDLPIIRATMNPGVTFRDEELVRDGDDSFGLMISQSTSLEIEHQGRNLRLSRGDATMMQVCETGSVGSRQHFGYIGVLIPHPEIAALGVRLDGTLMQRLPRQSEALQLVRGYIQALEKGKLGQRAEAREMIRRHIIDLVALAVTSQSAIGESRLSAVVAARLNAALRHIKVRFRDPELSVTAVARVMGISPRYLHRLLETSGASFSERVNELRLQQAFMLLTEEPPRRISDIALEVGFSDISHFDRLFRSRFGDTPRGVRGQRRQ